MSQDRWTRSPEGQSDVEVFKVYCRGVRALTEDSGARLTVGFGTDSFTILISVLSDLP